MSIAGTGSRMLSRNGQNESEGLAGSVRCLVAVVLILVPACGGDVTTPMVDAGADRDATAGCDTSPSGDAAAEAPAPPVVGLLHTQAQLQVIREHRHQAPWAAAYEALMSEAAAALSHTAAPIADLHVPYYYEDPEGHEAAKKALADDGYAAYACALAYQLEETPEERVAFADKAIEILDAWTTTNQRVSGGDGALVMMYKGIQLVYAGDLLGNYSGWSTDGVAQFRNWVGTQVSSSADEEKQRKNNHGAWGTLGAMAAAASLLDTAAVDVEIERMRNRIRDEIAANGELPEENLRTNSGMWYTYFALAPMTGAAQLARNVRGIDLFGYVADNGRSLRLALDRLFFYSLHPEQWPYPLPDGLEGELWQLLYPCADEIEIPSPDGWPGNLFEAMAAEYGVEQWSQWVDPHRPIRGWQVWLYPTLTRQRQ